MDGGALLSPALRAAAAGRRGLAAGVLAAWAAPRLSMRAVLDSRPGEGRLFLFAMLSGVFVLFGWLVGLTFDPASAGMAPERLASELSGAILGLVLSRTLALYGVAAVVRLGARAAGGTAGWRETRAATFWAALVAGPVHVIAAAMTALPGLPGLAVQALDFAGPLAFAAILASCVAETHGFRRASVVFLTMMGVSVVFWGGVLALTAA